MSHPLNQGNSSRSKRQRSRDQTSPTNTSQTHLLACPLYSPNSMPWHENRFSPTRNSRKHTRNGGARGNALGTEDEYIRDEFYPHGYPSSYPLQSPRKPRRKASHPKVEYVSTDDNDDDEMRMPRRVPTFDQSPVFDPYLDNSPIVSEGRFVPAEEAPAFAETYWDESTRDLYTQSQPVYKNSPQQYNRSPVRHSPSLSPTAGHPLQPTQLRESTSFYNPRYATPLDVGTAQMYPKETPDWHGNDNPYPDAKLRHDTPALGHSREGSLSDAKRETEEAGKTDATIDINAEDDSKTPRGKVKKGGKSKKAKPAPGTVTAKPVKVGELFRYATPVERLMMLLGILCAAGSGIAQPLMTVVFGNLTTKLLSLSSSRNAEEFFDHLNGLRHTVDMDAIYLTAIGVGSWIVIYIYMATWVYTGETITLRIRENYLKAILRQDVAYFDDLGAGEITTRIQSDIQLIQDGISDKIPLMVALLTTFIAGFIVAYIRNWRLALVMTAIIPCIVITAIVMNIFVAKYQQAELGYVAKAASLAEETLGSVRTAKAFGMNPYLSRMYDARNIQAMTASRRRAIATGVGVGGFFFCVYSAYALAFFFGSKLVADGNIASGVVMNVIFAVLIGAFGIAMLAPNLQALSFAQAAAGKVYETIDRKSKIDSASQEGLRPPQCLGNLSVEHVDFAYPSRPDVAILKDFTLSIPAGKTTALVGPSGSGKSTIVSLVERFYDPTRGQVKLDGINLDQLNIQWLRTQIGLVGQEPTLFSTTVWDNIAYGLVHTAYDNYSVEEKDKLIVEAARQANAHSFIMDLPQGYQTPVGERAALLSGGQKQRVSIARAIVKNPQILLLDEATSALDTASEGIVQEALDRAAQGRTTITIAHRLSTIKNADNIVVMKNGLIVEQGRHKSLLKIPHGVYAGLVATQQINQQNTQAALNQRTDYNDPSFWEGMLVKGYAEETNGTDLPVEIPQEDTAMTQVMRMSGLRQGAWPEEQAETGKKAKLPSLAYLMLRLAKIGKDLMIPYFLPGILCAVLTGAAYPCFAILFGLALSNYGQCQNQVGQPCPEPARSNMRHTANMHALYFFVIALISTVATMLQMSLIQQGSSILMQRLRSRMFQAYLRSDVAYFDEKDHSSGALTSSLAENTQKINGFIGVSLGTIVQSISQLIIGAIIALVYGWKLALVVIACIPFTLCAGFVRLWLVVMKDVKVRKAHLASSQKACESANAIRTVASLTREDDCLQEYRNSLLGASEIAKKAAVWGNIFYAFSQSTSYFVIALGFWYGSQLQFRQEYTAGQFFTIFTAVVFGSIQAGNVFNYVPDISNARTSAAAVFSLLDNVPEIDAESSHGITLDHCQGHVRFDQVRFHYPSRPSIQVLRGVSFDAPPGSYCALVGSSGCGKSTTIQLIERFYDATGGRILLDGHDIRTLNIASLRKHVALVSQEPTLYDGTIAFNLRLGAIESPENVTEEQIRHAANQANILEFIEGLPNGFDTQVGSKGTQLSGGQKQRIAIARALIRNPKILLLDEATSALDSDSEKIVQQALDSAARGRTTISIAHRLATISHADRIYAFQDGQIAESGDHKSLMARKGIYANLVKLQALDPS
ncbi:ABC-type xenobiotic transporter [Malassezia psittaci]|uniref:ABC-type xenobiotic transporter n=1 Tax=Malassezia psittaci TaxID=1821823 RepID=A0AAF0JD02_9BASI|nr:ABC-type xenobiotic transporter [Malassezia psittaci]